MSAITGPNTLLQNLVLSLDAASQRSYTSGSLVWYDVSGNGNNGTLVNGPGYSTANGGSIVFDGVDDYVNVVNTISNPTTLTINCFVSPSPMATTRVIFGYRSSLTELIQLTIQDNTTVYFQVRGSSNTLLNISQSIDISKKYMLTGVFNKTTSTHVLYVNAIPVQGTLDLSAQTLNSTLITIGATNNSTYIVPYSGSIHSVQVYNRALSAQEIQQNYNATKTRFGL